jgi:hypothetical protein
MIIGAADNPADGHRLFDEQLARLIQEKAGSTLSGDLAWAVAQDEQLGPGGARTAAARA